VLEEEEVYLAIEQNLNSKEEKEVEIDVENQEDPMEEDKLQLKRNLMLNWMIILNLIKF